MAYGFNDDKSKAEVYTKDEVLEKSRFLRITGSITINANSSGGVSFSQSKLNELFGFELDYSKASNLIVIGAGYSSTPNDRATLYPVNYQQDNVIYQDNHIGGYVIINDVNGVGVIDPNYAVYLWLQNTYNTRKTIYYTLTLLYYGD